MKNRTFKMLVALLMLPAFSAYMMASNTTETVNQVTGTGTLNTDVDYMITAECQTFGCGYSFEPYSY